MKTLITILYSIDLELNTIYENTLSVLYIASDTASNTHKAIALADEIQLTNLEQSDFSVTIIKKDPDITKFTVFFHPDPKAKDEIAYFGNTTTLFDNYTLVEQLPNNQALPKTNYIYFETPLATQEQSLPNPLTIQQRRLQANQQGNNLNFINQSEISITVTPTPTIKISPTRSFLKTPTPLQEVIFLLLIVPIVIGSIFLIKKRRHDL